MLEPRSSEPVSKKALAGILVFVLCCLLSTIRILRDASHSIPPGSDDISTRSDQRFANLKSRLPRSGVIGYVGANSKSATPDYYLAQYALAPLVLDRSPNHAIVIGNFPDSAPEEIPSNLRLIEDLGNGVLLLAGEEGR